MPLVQGMIAMDQQELVQDTCKAQPGVCCWEFSRNFVSSFLGMKCNRSKRTDVVEPAVLRHRRSDSWNVFGFEFTVAE